MSTATHPLAEYLEKVPEDRKEAFQKLWDTIEQNIPDGFEAAISYGMPGWVVPLSIFPLGYHCKKEEPLPFLSMANQKNFIALYHMGMYSDPDLLEWFTTQYPNHAKRKLDMGKSCVRLKKMDDIPYELIGELVSKMSVERWTDIYQKALEEAEAAKLARKQAKKNA